MFNINKYLTGKFNALTGRVDDWNEDPLKDDGSPYSPSDCDGGILKLVNGKVRMRTFDRIARAEWWGIHPTATPEYNASQLNAAVLAMMRVYGGGIIYFKSPSYNFAPFVSDRKIQLLGNRTDFVFPNYDEEETDDEVAMTVLEDLLGTGIPMRGEKQIVRKSIRFIAGANKSVERAQAVMRSYAMSADCPFIVTEDCTDVGFGSNFKTGDHAYIIESTRSNSVAMDIGVEFNAVNKFDSGEKITYLNHTVGNCRVGYRNRLGHMQVIGGSIDYNDIQIENLENSINGYSSGHMSLIGVHMETIHYPGILHIIVNWFGARLHLQSGSFWFENGNPAIAGNFEYFGALILNQGDLMFSDYHVRCNWPYNYVVEGKPPVIGKNCSYVDELRLVQWHPALAGWPNANLATGDLSFIIPLIGTITRSNEKPPVVATPAGKPAVLWATHTHRMVSDGGSDRAYVVTKPIFKSSEVNEINWQLFFNNYQRPNGENAYFKLLEYDRFDRVIGGFESRPANSVTDEFVGQYSGWQRLNPATQYYRIFIQGHSGNAPFYFHHPYIHTR